MGGFFRLLKGGNNHARILDIMVKGFSSTSYLFKGFVVVFAPGMR